MSDLIERAAAIDAMCGACSDWCDEGVCKKVSAIQKLPSAQPERAVKDCRNCRYGGYNDHYCTYFCYCADECKDWDKWKPSAQPEQRYTEEELRVFAHGISLSLLSKRSAQHWRYDKDTATEIEFLERLYEKVGADMRGEQDETD